MRRAGGLDAVFKTIRESNNDARLARALLQRVRPELLPWRLAGSMQYILIQSRDKVVCTQPSKRMLEFRRGDKPLRHLRRRGASRECRGPERLAVVVRDATEGRL